MRIVKMKLTNSNNIIIYLVVYTFEKVSNNNKLWTDFKQFIENNFNSKLIDRTTYFIAYNKSGQELFNELEQKLLELVKDKDIGKIRLGVYDGVDFYQKNLDTISNWIDSM